MKTQSRTQEVSEAMSKHPSFFSSLSKKKNQIAPLSGITPNQRQGDTSSDSHISFFISEFQHQQIHKKKFEKNSSRNVYTSTDLQGRMNIEQYRFTQEPMRTGFFFSFPFSNIPKHDEHSVLIASIIFQQNYDSEHVSNHIFAYISPTGPHMRNLKRYRQSRT